MNARIGPIDGFIVITMFRRIEVDAINVPRIVIVIPDKMHLEVALPDTAFTLDSSTLVALVGLG